MWDLYSALSFAEFCVKGQPPDSHCHSGEWVQEHSVPEFPVPFSSSKETLEAPGRSLGYFLLGSTAGILRPVFGVAVARTSMQSKTVRSGAVSWGENETPSSAASCRVGIEQGNSQIP